MAELHELVDQGKVATWPALGLDPRVAVGTPEEIAANPASYTGHYLRHEADAQREGADLPYPPELLLDHEFVELFNRHGGRCGETHSKQSRQRHCQLHCTRHVWQFNNS